MSAEGYDTHSGTASVGTADEQSDVSLTKTAAGVNLLPIAIAIAIVDCVVGGLMVFIRKRVRSKDCEQKTTVIADSHGYF